MDFLRKLGARYPIKDAPKLKEVARIICDEYGGDPRNMVNVTVAEFKERVQKIPVLRGQVLSALLPRSLRDFGLESVRDPENIDMPPDEPTARFTVRSGVLPCYKGMCDTSQGQLKPTQRLKEGIKRAWREVYNECLKRPTYT